MTKRQSLAYRPSGTPSTPRVWRSIDEKNDPERYRDLAKEETGVQVDLVAPSALVKKPDASVGRRGFLVAASATAAVTASGCIRRPAEQILPHTRAPEYALPGIALHFASTIAHNGEALGVLVEQHEGRPTKIEGNSEHSASNPGRLGAEGGSDIATQAAILGLYDQDRSAHVVRREGEARTESSWAEFDEAITAHVATLGDGASLAVLHEPITSPTLLRVKRDLQRRFPQARFYSWASVSDANVRAGIRAATGRRARPLIDYSVAQVIVSLDADFLQTEPGSVRAARLFAAGRRLESSTSEMNRLYVAESTLSVTGANADHRLRIASSDVLAYAKALAHELVSKGLPELSAVASEATAVEVPSEWLEKVAEDLANHRGRAVVVAGSRQPAAVHALVAAMNAALGANGAVLQYVDVVDADEGEPLADLAAFVERAEGATVVLLGTNPVYDAPADVDVGAALGRAALSVHLASHEDETSQHCTWHLPMAHALESWGDQRSIDGTIAIQQPLIAPLRNGRSAIEIVGMLSGEPSWRGYFAVRQTIANLVGDVAAFERAWREALHRGTFGRTDAQAFAGAVDAAAVTRLVSEATSSEGEWEVVFAPCPKMFDGRYSNNPWLLELPDPITKVVWDNAAMISPASAEELGVQTGRMLRITSGERSVEVPAVVVPGHADRSITLTLGWGRVLAGHFAEGCGVDVHPLRTAATFGFGRGFEVAAGGSFDLVVTQQHHSMDTDPVVPGIGRVDMPERPLAIVGTLEQYRAQPDFAQWREPTPNVGPLWREVDYQTPQEPAQGGTSWSLVPDPRPAAEDAPIRHAWGMVIDLTTCTGCSACIVACTAENNVASVGKAQVARGREMHWLRLDRYFVGDDVDNPAVAFQPVGCQHCEEAPCENVCPVNATEHSPEGINEMAYNRCIGTRYCMNNCPYKVRRFNYLAYQGHPTELQRMQFNPNVSIRMRGVMEKCNYCVQRIQAAKIAARNDGNRRPADGAIVPACAEACPSQALTFGDLNDEQSRVARLARTDRHYKLLALIGTQPRTTYLARVRNPNPEMGSNPEAV
ncbi:MAG: 4Fe-4S dicluster domain-containing protein [Sandaracinaceae bacterium]|nr:4Fe-4S dicluster domain-containing protein [Sandaracinaceae bacterium]